MVHRNKIYDIAHKVVVYPMIAFTLGFTGYLTFVFGDWMFTKRPVAHEVRKASIADKLAEQQTAREDELMQQQKAAEKQAF